MNVAQIPRQEIIFFRAWAGERTAEQCAAALKRSPEYVEQACAALGLALAKSRPKQNNQFQKNGTNKGPVKVLEQVKAADAARRKQDAPQARFEGENGLPYRKGPAQPLRPFQALVRRGRNLDWTPEMNDVLVRNYDDLTNEEIAYLLNLPRHSVEDRARALKIRKPKDFRTRLQRRRGSVLARGLAQAGELLRAGDYGQGLLAIDDAIKKARG